MGTRPSNPAGTTPGRLGALARALVDRYQRNFPLVPRPFARMAEETGSGEEEVLATLADLKARGVLDRVGAAVAPHRAGWSTLAAMAVPEDRLDDVARLVSGFREVNHNYEREHRFNLWFVVTAPAREDVERVLREIEARTGLTVLDLPLEEAYHIDLGFPIRWT